MHDSEISHPLQNDGSITQRVNDTTQKTAIVIGKINANEKSRN